MRSVPSPHLPSRACYHHGFPFFRWGGSGFRPQATHATPRRRASSACATDCAPWRPPHSPGAEINPSATAEAAGRTHARARTGRSCGRLAFAGGFGRPGASLQAWGVPARRHNGRASAPMGVRRHPWACIGTHGRALAPVRKGGRGRGGGGTCGEAPPGRPSVDGGPGGGGRKAGSRPLPAGLSPAQGRPRPRCKQSEEAPS